MKTINLTLQFLLILVIVSVSYFWLSSLNSAFEADRLCHNDLSTRNIHSETFGCDHDIETHQWILYENQEDSNLAKVIKRYRYRFL